MTGLQCISGHRAGGMLPPAVATTALHLCLSPHWIQLFRCLHDRVPLTPASINCVVNIKLYTRARPSCALTGGDACTVMLEARVPCTRRNVPTVYFIWKGHFQASDNLWTAAHLAPATVCHPNTRVLPCRLHPAPTDSASYLGPPELSLWDRVKRHVCTTGYSAAWRVRLQRVDPPRGDAGTGYKKGAAHQQLVRQCNLHALKSCSDHEEHVRCACNAKS